MGKIKGYVGEIKGLLNINIASDAHHQWRRDQRAMAARSKGTYPYRLPKIWIQTNINSHTPASVGLAYARQIKTLCNGCLIIVLSIHN